MNRSSSAAVRGHVLAVLLAALPLAVRATAGDGLQAAALGDSQAAAFRKPIAHDAEFFPLTRGWLRPGDVMRATVIRNTWTVLESQGQLDSVLKHCDGVAVQMQRSFQSRPAAASLVEEVRPLVARFRAANPEVKVSIQLWLGRQTVVQMAEGFRAIEPYLDVAVLGTHSNRHGVLEVLRTLRAEPK